MTARHTTTRRDFLTHSAQGAAAIGLASVAGTTLADDAPAFRKTVEIDTRARAVRGLAVTRGDHILVAADKSVLSFSGSGKRVGEVDLRRPTRCVAADVDGNWYVGLKDRVVVVGDLNGPIVDWPAVGRDASLVSLAVSPTGDVFAADAGNQVVWRFSRTGKLLGRIARDKSAFKSTRAFFPVSVSSDELVHVGDPGRRQVAVYTAEGKRVNAWGEASRKVGGFAGCCNPVALASKSDEKASGFVTAERGQVRVKQYDAKGRFVALVAGPEHFEDNAKASAGDEGQAGCATGGLDVAADSRGGVVVLDRATRRVSVWRV